MLPFSICLFVCNNSNQKRKKNYCFYFFPKRARTQLQKTISSEKAIYPSRCVFLYLKIISTKTNRILPYLLLNPSVTSILPSRYIYYLCVSTIISNRQIKIQILDENPVLHSLQSPPASHSMFLPDSGHHKPPRRRERQRVHKPLLPKPDQKIAYNRNRPYFLQQFPVLLAVRHVRIPQPNAIIVASARQQIRSSQRRAAHDPTPRRVLSADWTHRINPVRLLPINPPKNRDMNRKNGLFFGNGEEIQRSVEISRGKVLRANHRAALHALIDASPAENHLRGRLDLPQPHGIVRRAAQNPRVSPR